MEHWTQWSAPGHGTIIPESTDLNIQFSDIPKVWKLDEADKSGRRYVSIGGTAGRPGRSTVNNWFQIERLGPFGYKLIYCPKVCDSSKTVWRSGDNFPWWEEVAVLGQTSAVGCVRSGWHQLWSIDRWSSTIYVVRIQELVGWYENKPMVVIFNFE